MGGGQGRDDILRLVGVGMQGSEVPRHPPPHSSMGGPRVGMIQKESLTVVCVCVCVCVCVYREMELPTI